MKNRKALVLFALLLTAVILLASRVSDGQGEITTDSPDTSDVHQSDAVTDDGDDTTSGSSDTVKSKYVFRVARAGGYELAVNSEMADALSALGEPLRYNESPSCAYEGLDKEYVYPGFSVVTRPDGERDLISMITFTDDSVTTPEGVYLGASAEEVRAAYGEGAESGRNISYSHGGTSLVFGITDGYVSSIHYIYE